jgi:hypothetical protein
MCKEILDISAKITGISYKPLLCKELDEFKLEQLDKVLQRKAS